MFLEYLCLFEVFKAISDVEERPNQLFGIRVMRVVDPILTILPPSNHSTPPQVWCHDCGGLATLILDNFKLLQFDSCFGDSLTTNTEHRLGVDGQKI